MTSTRAVEELEIELRAVVGDWRGLGESVAKLDAENQAARPAADAQFEQAKDAARVSFEASLALSENSARARFKGATASSGELRESLDELAETMSEPGLREVAEAWTAGPGAIYEEPELATVERVKRAVDDARIELGRSWTDHRYAQSRTHSVSLGVLMALIFLVAVVAGAAALVAGQ